MKNGRGSGLKGAWTFWNHTLCMRACMRSAGVPRLYDLIKLSPAAEKAGLRLAFCFALGNTLVAKDLEQVRTE